MSLTYFEHMCAYRTSVPRRFRPLAVVTLATILASSAGGRSERLSADTVYLGTILTLDTKNATAEAIAVKGDRVVAIGKQSDVLAAVDSAVRRVRLPGVAVPGLADAHVHALAFGEQLETLDLRGLQKDEILRRVGARAKELPAGAWVTGRGWDQGHWQPSTFPTALELDTVTSDHPAVLTRIDGHSVWVNSAAMHRAGIDRNTPDPVSGRLVRSSDGTPTGMLVDAAVRLVTKVMPAPTHAQLRKRLEAATARYVQWGLTSVHDAGVGEEGIGIYKELLAERRLPLRVYVMAEGTGPTAEHMLSRDPEIGLGDHRLTIRSFKVFLDGALGSRGAELLEPYTDAPAERGLELMNDADFGSLVRRAIGRGYQVNAHAIGDKAVRRALDTFERYGGSDVAANRFRVEHASVIDPADLPRFARLHVIASTQPGFVGEYSRWAQDRLGPERVKLVLPIADLLKSGAVVAAGTDYPAADSGNPLLTLYALVTRRGADGTPAGGWHPEQCVDVTAALKAMTAAPAFAAFEEQQVGSLAVGRLADMTVLSADPRSAALAHLRDLSVTMTIIGGKPVYEAKNNTAWMSAGLLARSTN
jgi:predicted amidohydrolase YtcJ